MASIEVQRRLDFVDVINQFDLFDEEQNKKVESKIVKHEKVTRRKNVR